ATSISSVSVRQTACPADASERSPFALTIRDTRLVTLLRATITESPQRTDPLASVPEYPRKSGFGRLTNWIGNRNGFDLRSDSTSTVSSCCRMVGPSYHVILALTDAMLSPKRAQTGIARTDLKDSREANAIYSSTISLNRLWE